MSGCVCALDCFAACLACWAQCGAAADAACIRCGCAGAAPTVVGAAPAVVVSAPSEYERRAVAWLYHHNEAPDLADWRGCLARFGLESAPAHVLAGPHRAVEVRVDVAAGLYSAAPAGAAAAPQRVTLGALAPRRLLAGPKARPHAQAQAQAHAQAQAQAQTDTEYVKLAEAPPTHPL